MSLSDSCKMALKKTPWEQMMLWLRINMIKTQCLANNKIEIKWFTNGKRFTERGSMLCVLCPMAIISRRSIGVLLPLLMTSDSLFLLKLWRARFNTRVKCNVWSFSTHKAYSKTKRTAKRWMDNNKQSKCLIKSQNWNASNKGHDSSPTSYWLWILKENENADDLPCWN